eukprot:scaffold7351_cov28-Tisochrysis_lutea.AAC.3
MVVALPTLGIPRAPWAQPQVVLRSAQQSIAQPTVLRRMLYQAHALRCFRRAQAVREQRQRLQYPSPCALYDRQERIDPPAEYPAGPDL